jgi:predicted nucleotidyltransferase
VSLENRLREFKAALLDKGLSDELFVQRHIVYPTPFVFDGQEGLYFLIKRDISEYFQINPEDVKMVGSAKLGFSIAPSQLWKPFDDESDIDMVIVSAPVFDRFWKQLYDFNINLTVRTTEEQIKYNRFLKYFFKGWIRPDLFPFDYHQREEWDRFFKSISYGQYGYRKVTGAIYRDMEFFERYHVVNVKRLRLGGFVDANRE